MSLFIIIGIVILIAIGGIVFYQKNQTDQLVNQKTNNPQIQTTPFDTSALQFFITQCLQHVEEDALIRIGSQGGFDTVTVPSVFYYSNVLKIPLYFNATDHEENIPTQNKIEQELEMYVTRNFQNSCDVLKISENGLDVQTGELQTTQILSRENVKVTIEYPLIITKNNVQTKLHFFSATIPTRILEMYEESKSIIEDTKKESMCISCTADWALQNQFIVAHDENILSGTNVISIRDQTKVIQGQMQVFTFALTSQTRKANGQWWKW